MYYVDTRKIYFSEREAQCAAEKLNCDSRAELAKILKTNGFLQRYEQNLNKKDLTKLSNML